MQPVPFFPGSNVGHMGAVYPSVGLQGLQGEPLGSLFRPRNIDIRIRAGIKISFLTAFTHIYM